MRRDSNTGSDFRVDDRETRDRATVLVCRVGARLCALPLEHVGETMRPLAIEPIAGMPEVVLGVSRVRGKALPVIDARRLLGADASRAPERLVTLALGARSAMLAVDSVAGIRTLHEGAFEPLPPLLRESAGEALSSLGTLDDQLLFVLRSGRIVPEELWDAMGAPG